MQILLYKWGAYNMADLEENLILMGHTVDTFSYIFDNFEEEPACFDHLTKILQQEHYDFVMSINYFPVLSDACNYCQTKYVSWTCDCPLLTLFTKSVFNTYNYIFSFDKWVYWNLKAYGIKKVFYLPLAVDIPRLNAIPITNADIQKYTSEVSFVGSLYEKNDYDSLTNLPDYLRGYLDAAMYAQSLLPDQSILEDMITEEIEDEFSQHAIEITSENYFGGLPLIIATTFLGFKTTDTERRTYLNYLSKQCKVDLYSNSDSSDLILVNNKGSVDYLTEMPKIFRLSKINLNITVRTIKTGIPLRIFDVLGCGGFLLTNKQPELSYFFKEGFDLDTFTCKEEAAEKVDFYLKHDTLRKKIAQNGYETAKKFHTYDIRLEQMLQYIKLNPI